MKTLWITYSWEDNKKGGNSKARNPRIQNMLRMIGYGENIGSGFPKIIAAWKQASWDAPKLDKKIELDEVELTLPIPQTADTQVCVSDGVSKEVSDTARNILNLIKDNPKIGRKELTVKTKISLKNVQKHINKLKEVGLIQRIGSPKYGYWKVKMLINNIDKVLYK